MLKSIVAFFVLGLVGCAAELEPVGDEPVAGSVAVETQALTQTVTLASVLQHFGLGTPTLTAVPGTTTYWRANLPKKLYTKVGDTAVFELKNGYWQGLEQPLDELCRSLSNRKVYLMVNSSLAQGLNLEGKIVVR